MVQERIPRIAEVFEDLATEVEDEIIVLEDFLNLNPDVTVLPNLNIDVNRGLTGMQVEGSRRMPRT